MRWLLWLAASASAGCLAGSTSRMIDQTFELQALRTPSSEASDPALDDASLSGALERAQVLALAIARDPGLRSLAHEARAALHSARAEGALPAPEVNAQVWNLPLARPYALGDASMYMLELRQMFPAAGSRDARARAAAEEARGRVSALVAREAEVRSRAGEAYADYVQSTLQRQVREAHREMLGAMLDTASSRLAAGGPLADIPRIETEQARNRRSIARVEADIARVRAALNALLRRPHDAPLGPPSSVVPETVSLPLDELLSLAARSRGDLGEARARVRSAHARTEAASAESRWPSITAALGYWQDPLMRPGLGATVAASLPWVWAGARERLAEARERELAESEAAEGVTVTVRGEVSTAQARLRGLEHELGVLHREAWPAAARSTEALRAAYTAGRGGLLDWLDAARQLHDIGEEEAEVTASMVRTATELERAVGVALPRSPIAIDQGRAR